MTKRHTIVFLVLALSASAPVFAGGSVDDLVQQLQQGKRKDKIRAAQGLVGYKESSRAVDALIVAVDDRNIQVRKAAVKALGKMRAQKAMDRLVRSLSEDDYLWEAPLKAIAQIKAPSAYEILVKAYHSSGDHNRHVAIEALGLYGDARAMPIFVKALSSENVFERKKAARALGRINAPRAVDYLIGSLSDREKTVRENAVYALSGYSADERAFAALISSLEDQGVSVRMAAAYGLGKEELSQSSAGLQALISACQDPHASVRAAAAQSLSFYNEDRSIKTLTLLLADEKPNVRIRAYLALKELTGKDLPPDPQKWQEWMARTKGTSR